MRLRALTRRQALKEAGRAGAAGALALVVPAGLLKPRAVALAPSQAATLRAAVARIVPASGSGDWSAADVGADNYIATLLEGTSSIYAGGPYRSRFGRFQKLSRIKRIGWSKEVKRLRTLYGQGLAQLDSMAGGNFANAPAQVQDAILTELDDSGSDFFSALFNHTLEGTYSHPVYGGNKDYRAWQAFGYAGDVHGVRFPNIGPPDAPWNVYGGYAPEEMIQPGKGTTT
ncbi:MAG TPA: gluconate 2-dehydrogenase subunit 3 family protein [Solirubrobacteraceae bacterium]